MTQKELLTIEKCMQDLYAQRKGELQALSGLCLGSIFLTLSVDFIAGVLLFAFHASSKVLIACVLGLPWLLPAVILAGILRFWIQSERCLREIRPVVVRSTLRNKHEMEQVADENSPHIYLPFPGRTLFTRFDEDPRDHTTGYWNEYNVLYFPEGRFLAPEKNFTWSKEYSMTGTGLFQYAEPGDDFYLLLEEPWAGNPNQEILLACPAKLFRWEESEISHTNDDERK